MISPAPRRVNWPGVALILLCVISGEIAVVMVWHGIELALGL